MLIKKQKGITELHLGKYEISSNDKLTRIHFSDHWQKDGKLRVKFMEREVLDENGELVRDGSHDIHFNQIESVELAEHYRNVMRDIVENATIKEAKAYELPYFFEGHHNGCEISTTGGYGARSKKDLLLAIDKSFVELKHKLDAKNKKTHRTL